MTPRFHLIASVLGLVAVGACSSSAAPTATSEDAVCTLPVPVDRFKELLIVDDAVVNDARARNATAGVWSFRHAIEAMMPNGGDASAFTLSWLRDWEQRKSFAGTQLDREPRDFGMRSVLTCPWLKRTPANACNEDCSACTGSKLDLSLAPFRLIGIANRMDLGSKADAAGPNGEGRLIFALTDIAADDAQARPLPMTLIMEYRLPTDLSRVEWANQWHALSSFKDYGEDFRSALEKVTNRFSSRGVWSDGRNSSALAQLRTNESAFNWIWQQREFRLDPLGQLRVASTKNTPAESFNNTEALADFIRTNADKLKADSFVVPERMLGGSANALLFQWTAPGIDEVTRQSFSRETCNGCHTEHPTVDSLFHVSPFRSGVEKLSPLLNNPDQPGSDELSLRTSIAVKTLCAK